MDETNAGSASGCPLSGAGAAPALLAGLDRSLASACIHCGLCLPACPTYLATGLEAMSPRGRVHLIDLLGRGEIDIADGAGEHLESCLGCLGCQTACPSGVQYGKLLDQVRPYLASSRPRWLRSFVRLIFARLLPDYRLLRRVSALLRFWQKSGGRQALARLPFLRGLIDRADRWQEFLPPVPKHVPLPRQSWLSGEKSGSAVLFAGCVMDILYNHVNHASLKLLTAQRKVVSVPEQTCCGALAFHAGETDIARSLAQANIELIGATAGEIVVTSAGCGAMLRQYPHLFEKDSPWHERAADFSRRVVDLTESLSSGCFAAPARQLSGRVAYHAACHLYHAQQVREAPAKLLAALPGLCLVELPEMEYCCGSAGIFNLTHTELSLAVLERKMAMIAGTGCDTIVTTNPGCLLQIEAGARARGMRLRVLHIAELLAEAYCS